MGHERIMFGPYLDLLYIQTDSSWSKAHVHAMTTFWDHVSAMFGQYWSYIWPYYNSKPAKAPKFLRQSQYDFYTISQFVVFFTHLLKFYSDGAVDLWSCLFGMHNSSMKI